MKIKKEYLFANSGFAKLTIKKAEPKYSGIMATDKTRPRH
jgi:hypothetical protein